MNHRSSRRHFLEKSALAVIAALSLSLLPAGAADTNAPATTMPSDSNYKAHFAWNQDCERRVAAMKGKPCDIIFIGDSITDNFTGRPTPGWGAVGGPVWDKYYASRRALNFGVGADATQNVLWRLDHMDIKEFKPKVAVVLIGTNNKNNAPADIAAGVKAVVEKTRQTFAGVKIILVSILPNARATEKMAEANQLIQPLGDNQNVFFFDLASKMTPVGNSWKGLGPDHLHLVPEGYELWASEMEPLLTKLLAEKSRTNHFPAYSCISKLKQKLEPNYEKSLLPPQLHQKIRAVHRRGRDVADVADVRRRHQCG
jgi:lysophospholipase L1-like esterase